MMMPQSATGGQYRYRDVIYKPIQLNYYSNNEDIYHNCRDRPIYEKSVILECCELSGKITIYQGNVREKSGNFEVLFFLST